MSAPGHPWSAPRRPVRVGIDVGGTFTKAIAIVPGDAHPLAEAVHPTTHHAPGGVSEGVATVVRMLVERLGEGRSIELVAFSTTQAMNALLEGDVAPVGVIGIGAAPDVKRARSRTKVGELALAPGRKLRTEHVFIDATGGLEVGSGRRRDRPAGQGRLPGARSQRGVLGRHARARGAGRPARPRPRPRDLRRARADRHLRPRDPHGDGCHQRQHPAARAAHRGDRRAGAHRRRARRAAARAARRRRRDEPRRLPHRTDHDDRLGAGGRRCRRPAPAIAPRRAGGRVRRHELQRLGRARRPHRAALAARDGPADRDPRDRQLGGRRRRRQHGAPGPPQGGRGRAAQRPCRRAAVRLLRHARGTGRRARRADRAASRRPRELRDAALRRRALRAHRHLCRERARSRAGGQLCAGEPRGRAGRVRAAGRAPARRPDGDGAGRPRRRRVEDRRGRHAGRPRLRPAA